MQWEAYAVAARGRDAYLRLIKVAPLKIRS